MYTPSKNYTFRDYAEFFIKIGYPIGYNKTNGEKNYRNNLRAPGVDTLLVMGNGTDTLVSVKSSTDDM